MWSGKVEFHAQILQRLTSLESKLGELNHDYLWKTTVKYMPLNILTKVLDQLGNWATKTSFL